MSSPNKHLPYHLPYRLASAIGAETDEAHRLVEAAQMHVEGWLDATAPWSCFLPSAAVVAGGAVVWTGDTFWPQASLSPFQDPAHPTHMVCPKTGRWRIDVQVGYVAAGTSKLRVNGATDFAGGALTSYPGFRSLQKGDYVELVVTSGTPAAGLGGPFLCAFRLGPVV